MLLLDPSSGNAYPIVEILPDNKVKINASLSLTGVSIVGVYPQHVLYKARKESRAYYEEYSIGVHAHGEPVYALWLWNIVFYGLHRYNEALLEGNCLDLASFRSSDISKNPMGGDNIFSRYITIKGIVRHSWIKSPTRVIENVKIIDSDNEVSPTGIKILSNIDDQLADEDSVWKTVDDGEDC